MKIPQKIVDAIQPLDRARFEKIKDREFRPHYNLTDLKYLRGKARNERDLRELYRGRAPYELLQNADDAEAKKVAFILSGAGLVFAHNGQWFTVENFRNLADGWSDKDPSQCIGHKGLGFRSVLDITPAPHLAKVDPKGFFAVKFTWALNNGHIQEAFRRDSSLRERYEEWKKYGQMVCPVMAIPGLAKKHNLGEGSSIFDWLVRGRYGDGFTTMFWFPATDPDIDPGVLRELGPIPIVADAHGREVLLGFLEDEIGVLLPFLASVEEVAVYEKDRCIGRARISRGSEEQEEGEITVHLNINGQSQSESSFFQMRFNYEIPLEILNKPDTPKAVKEMKVAKVLLSTRVEDGQPVHDDESQFHVYFPTQESTGVGFVVHGDFYVKPDRTRLMGGEYNDWLLGRAAKAAANEFLTELLGRYHPRRVFGALSPTSFAATDAAETFVSLLSTELQTRAAPFVPTSAGLLEREAVILPPGIDKDGFWETHFSEVVADVVEAKTAFLAHEEDGRRTRGFLKLAQVQVLEPEDFLAFIEVSSQQERPPGWWYECYSYMANDRELTHYDRSSFEGHKLIPTSGSSVIAVPDDTSLVVCLPPTDDASNVRVPDCFTAVFVFLDPQLAAHLARGEDTVRSWVLDRFGISRFEATELVPRAIRGVVTHLFSGELSIGPAELRQAWSFIKRIIETSRAIDSSLFWDEVGRFPLPIETAEPGSSLKPRDLVPAFLSYWPDSFLGGNSALSGIEGLRRIDRSFLNELVPKSGSLRNGWIEFLGNAGVSAAPKLLRFRRIAVKGQDLPFTPGAPSQVERGGSSGERQRDQNQAVVDALREENLWDTTVGSAPSCGHDYPRVLQSLTLLEGLRACTQVAQQEYQNGDDNWRQRLGTLVGCVPVHSVADLDEDSAFCRGGGPGGHSVPAGSYLRRQLDHYAWLPSSQGPESSSKCFLRLSSRRLISKGRADEELGDRILPYVAVDNRDDLTRLERLGVEVLDDAASSSPSALVRALALLGERLSTEWGQEEILEVRSRWRLVRGAIQEMYRSLNQPETDVDFPPEIKFAIRWGGRVEFRPSPLYYAEPGSPIEQAFTGTLPLFDADRPYPSLFERMHVTRLRPDHTVREELPADEASVPAARLRDEIVNNLAPFLLAPVIARSDNPKQSDLILRRLGERFEVKAAHPLTVSFSLIQDPSIERAIEFPNFYLQRRLVPGAGVIQETHYTLYVAGNESVSLSTPDLDADALGEALAPVFLDGIGDELAGLLPRIASRYQQVQGKRDSLEEFLYHQLRISNEAQEMAWAKVSGEVDVAGPIPPPPPIKVISTSRAEAGEEPDDRPGLEDHILRHEERLREKATSFVRKLATGDRGKEQAGEATIEPIVISQLRAYEGVTPEQRERGRRGEKEIKRRLERPGGWETFTLLADMRDAGCGYDLLCAMGDRKVKLEIKTFVRDGRVVVTSLELQEAAASQDDYYLVGVLDDGKPEYEWSTFLIRNPIDILLTAGELDVQAKLQASAADVFDVEDRPA